MNNEEKKQKIIEQLDNEIKLLNEGAKALLILMGSVCLLCVAVVGILEYNNYEINMIETAMNFLTLIGIIGGALAAAFIVAWLLRKVVEKEE